MSLILTLKTKIIIPMNEIKKRNFRNFEALTETTDGFMIGGFTAIILPSYGGAAYGATNTGCTVTNNCNGGNCAKNCGVSGGGGFGG
jgi:hypothetical protein